MITKYGEPAIIYKQGLRYILVKYISNKSALLKNGEYYYGAQHNVEDAYNVYDLNYKYLEAAYKNRFEVAKGRKLPKQLKGLKGFK